MRHYHATVVPQSSLFLGRDRGNRVVRHSFHYIPASTIGGALNTRLYQIGRRDLSERFRFGNLYPSAKLRTGPAADGDHEKVWIPAPRNLYYCPACGRGHVVESFGPESALAERICSEDSCQAMRRPEQGVVEADLNGDCLKIYPDERAAAPPTVSAQTVGRTELHRTTAAHVDGRLHQVELLQVRGLPFRGDVWVDDAAGQVLRPGAVFRLSIGGLRSRGCGRVELRIGEEIDDTPPGSGLFLVETPLLPLGERVDRPSGAPVEIAAPYARVAVNERWAAKPLQSGKGLVSFLDTLALGSALAAADDIALGEMMYFYRQNGSELELYGFDLATCGGHDYGADYDFADLWTLGYGRLRRLLSQASDE